MKNGFSLLIIIPHPDPHIRDLRTKVVTVTDTESGKKHLILRLSQNYKYTNQIVKISW